jgi:hypothetical protein
MAKPVTAALDPVGLLMWPWCDGNVDAFAEMSPNLPGGPLGRHVLYRAHRNALPL